ncbi:hypothetical protein GGX14DRAFT_391970 [Mycena pura]|uniref:Uncharacterized protein n=1 Tax=Mycena pura TaxID=153505 RepID=A0AAD6VPC0_9AGAR|nr:hypothetical protein GGX14DRAFT_391970 [Mycena pura]
MAADRNHTTGEQPFDSPSAFGYLPFGKDRSFTSLALPGEHRTPRRRSIANNVVLRIDEVREWSAGDAGGLVAVEQKTGTRMRTGQTQMQAEARKPASSRARRREDGWEARRRPGGSAQRLRLLACERTGVTRSRWRRRLRVYDRSQHLATHGKGCTDGPGVNQGGAVEDPAVGDGLGWAGERRHGNRNRRRCQGAASNGTEVRMMASSIVDLVPARHAPPHFFDATHFPYNSHPVLDQQLSSDSCLESDSRSTGIQRQPWCIVALN